MEHLSIKTNIYSIQDLENHYKKTTKGHWFDKSTMRFFKSRINEKLYYGNELILFISGEQGPRDSSRRYSIRSYNPQTGEINTVGLFQKYKTLAAAKLAASKLVEGA